MFCLLSFSLDTSRSETAQIRLTHMARFTLCCLSCPTYCAVPSQNYFTFRSLPKVLQSILLSSRYLTSMSLSSSIGIHRLQSHCACLLTDRAKHPPYYIRAKSSALKNFSLPLRPTWRGDQRQFVLIRQRYVDLDE